MDHASIRQPMQLHVESEPMEHHHGTFTSSLVIIIQILLMLLLLLPSQYVVRPFSESMRVIARTIEEFLCKYCKSDKTVEVHPINNCVLLTSLVGMKITEHRDICHMSHTRRELSYPIILNKKKLSQQFWWSVSLISFSSICTHRVQQ